MCCEERSEKAPGRRWHFGWALKVERREKHKFEGSKQTSVAGGQALGLSQGGNGGKLEVGKALQAWSE